MYLLKSSEQGNFQYVIFYLYPIQN